MSHTCHAPLQSLSLVLPVPSFSNCDQNGQDRGFGSSHFSARTRRRSWTGSRGEGPLLAAQGDVLMDVAEVFRLATRNEDAASTAQRARETYEAKGMVVPAHGAATFIEQLGTSEL
jgi:hypothetical protein